VCQSIDSKIGARRRAPRQPADCPGGCAGRLARKRKRPARRPLPSASTPAAGSSDTAPTLLLCSTLRHTSVNRHCPDTAPTLPRHCVTVPTLPRHCPDTTPTLCHCPDTAPTLPRHCPDTARHSDTPTLQGSASDAFGSARAHAGCVGLFSVRFARASGMHADDPDGGGHHHSINRARARDAETVVGAVRPSGGAIKHPTANRRTRRPPPPSIPLP
jgi:hypothetical protein